MSTAEDQVDITVRDNSYIIEYQDFEVVDITVTAGPGETIIIIPVVKTKMRQILHQCLVCGILFSTMEDAKDHYIKTHFNPSSRKASKNDEVMEMEIPVEI